MNNGFIKVACATTDVKVADCKYNEEKIIETIKKASANKAKILVLPELCITGYTCSDLFLQEALLNSALKSLVNIIEETKQLDILTVLGLPIEYKNKLYNCAAVISKGNLLGIVPKTHVPNYNEFYEYRHFSKAPKETSEIKIGNYKCLFGTKILFQCENIKKLILGVEICEDLWAICPPSISHAMAGATVIVNLSASNETVGKRQYRKNLVNFQSAKLISAYLYSSAGEGESSTDLVYSGHNIISEYGTVLNESKPFENSIIYSEIDIEKLIHERRRISTYPSSLHDEYKTIKFSLQIEETKLTRYISPHPFIPNSDKEMHDCCEAIMNIQSMGLKKRLIHTHTDKAIIGVSGGLDSTLALLVIIKALKKIRKPLSDIIAITMPCFGTTKRTKNNAQLLCENLGVTFKEIDITKEVNIHFNSISHDQNTHDTTYENSQARIRTLVLMDMANKTNGIVIGTGDLSELALGWATYNGDHMSMYAVNSSVPKTLIKYLILHEANTSNNPNLKKILLDILDTPVSPELLPSKNDEIVQKTEDLIGPYELHDFFLYNIIRWGFSPSKIYYLSKYAFKNIYDSTTILKWLKVFYKRFFSQQFKRSCLPDGPKVGSVTLSPRGDFRMPSDASVNLWLNEIENLDNKQ